MAICFIYTSRTMYMVKLYFIIALLYKYIIYIYLHVQYMFSSFHVHLYST